MFSVIFEVHPKQSHWDSYLALGRMLRPELEQIDGFIENVRYRSLTRGGWLVSLSDWRDEKALVRWRTQVKHHDVREEGREKIFVDYHLRVGELTHDTRLQEGRHLRQERFDETQTGPPTAMIVNATRPEAWLRKTSPLDAAKSLGLDTQAEGLVAWDIFEAVLVPGDIVLLLSWQDHQSAESYAGKHLQGDDARVRQIRIIRSYGMFERREAPQYYPDANRAPVVLQS
jgi:heme-degrading monooxygenase HmoA